MRTFLVFVISMSLFASAVFAQEIPAKRNKRPAKALEDKGAKKKESAKTPDKPVYFYEFEKPEFYISNVRIEHDENGLGLVNFKKNDFEDSWADPLALSEAALLRIKNLWEAICFLEAPEKLQSEIRDYGHLGTMKLRIKRGENEHLQEFNWTENLDARALTQEYKNIGNQFIWMFDFDVARRNQPLETPRIMKRLESYIERNVVSDPVQLLPFLQKISSDEMVPLITRNFAARLVEKIKKMQKAEEPKEK